jgi:hypothetical protein
LERIEKLSEVEQETDESELEYELLESLLKKLLEIKLAEALEAKEASLSNSNENDYFEMNKRNPEFTNSLILYSKLFKNLSVSENELN